MPLPLNGINTSDPRQAILNFKSQITHHKDKFTTLLDQHHFAHAAVIVGLETVDVYAA